MGHSTILLTCEHASNRLPERLGTLGLMRDVLEGHIAWDIGAGALTERLSDLLDAPAIMQRFSRLAYNCNRPPDAADVIPHSYKGCPIPGNLEVTGEERALRQQAICDPFHALISSSLNAVGRRSPYATLISVQSFAREAATDDLDIGVVCDKDTRLADALYEVFCHDATYRVARNKPYGPDQGVTHILKSHGMARHLLNVMVTVRNDLIHDSLGQDKIARYLASVIREAMTGLTVPRPHRLEPARRRRCYS
ncbi:N-formylglutamate amidohydrolase [Kordiimonas aestuarii]|uniref:N-formylglutamate amidohydrolase n=1 Tax=Kordiimonas aestuarii TaxID=1005925 RepID=UPI0021D3E69B|nr:N-formylglutamate amidohydrolase [Kordiimonas aestuarii]